MKPATLLLDSRLIIVVILFFAIIFYDFSKNQKLPLLSNKCFTVMLYFTAISLFFNLLRIIISVFANIFTTTFDRISSQLFYGTLIMVVVLLLWYVEILGNDQKRMKWKKVFVSMLPFALFFIFLIFGDLNYEIRNQQLYVHGSMTIAFIFTLLVYCGWIFVSTYRYKKTLQKEHRRAIQLGLIMLVSGSVMQLLDAGLIYSEVVVTLMILFIYLTFENPKIYIDNETGAFNKRAFHLMLNEKKAAGTRLILVSVVVEDIKRVQSMVGHDNSNHILEMIAIVMTDNFRSDFHRRGRVNRKHRRAAQFSLYHSRSNVMTFITEEPFATIQQQLVLLDQQLKKPLRFSEYTIAVKMHIDVILTGHYEDQENCDEVYEMMNYMAIHNKATADTSIYLLNEDIIKQKLRYSTIENMLRKAIEQDGFEMVYQPIYHVKDQQFLSSEALVRLKDNTTVGFVSPEEFIPIAENKGLIMELGEIVFTKVCAFTQEQKLPDRGIEYIEVNLSGIQCVHPDLPSQLHQIMKKYAIAPGFINLEITETAFVESGEMLQENMLKLRQMGCSFSMDDFGTGYSNLSRMAEVVYDLVKLDKSLIWPCFNSEMSAETNKANAILENIIKLLQQLNVNIVAEGVETEAMANYLNDRGVTHLQGYYYSKPINEGDYLDFLTTATLNRVIS
ncbi:EAL domain-containing protein [Acetobacterium woodii]|uniref:Putative sensory transduction protein n=1 Tax=Acetobacterium woodii (strain ATCC 29683 / DSM 1030 / JCM 2381 / KCTC 1655 / WB1) TaxID=931626 RepID=H6LIJ8_ACEWD|nr:EAL domain-containing protein [Acetobacterium woodii]AFA48572.1 putative sensory transduction protein [Acetobacterium woodii DSM 1030]